MSVNKGATIRYIALDRCLQNRHRRFYIEDLLEECNKALREYYGEDAGIQKRQLQQDLKFMKDPLGYDAPIKSVSDGNRRKYYIYSDPDFSISKKPLNAAEADNLKAALGVLSRFQGLPQFNWLEDLMSRLDQEFLLSDSLPVMSFEENPYYEGAGRLFDLYSHIQNKHCLEITYQPFDKPQRIEIIHPYFLKQYNSRWFLWGYNEKYQSLSTFAIDRISEIKEYNIKYIENTEYDFNSYFEDAIGNSIPYNENPQKIHLRINADLWPYIRTKPLHASQKILQQHDRYIDIEIEVYINYELKSLLMSHGSRIEVLAPGTLRNEFRLLSETLSQKYSGNAH